MQASPRIAMVAGETSGDLLAGLLLDGMQAHWPALQSFGIGGPQMARRGFSAPLTTSMGRLFDAVASIAGIRHRIGYDAQAAMELEALARAAGPQEGYRFGLEDGVLDPAPVIAAAASDVLGGTPAAFVAARFQQGVVDLVTAVAGRGREATGLRRVTLSGGVFLNAALTSGCAQALADAGFEVLRHQRVPASDAGLALGQIAVLAHRHRTSDDRQRGTLPEREMPCA